MATAVELPVAERLFQVLKHLGIAQAHVAARAPGDWQGLATAHPEVISSLTLVCPQGMDPGILGTFASRLLVFTGDQGQAAESARRVMAQLPGSTLIALRDYY